jgi:hypothetical protein
MIERESVSSTTPPLSFQRTLFSWRSRYALKYSRILHDEATLRFQKGLALFSVCKSASGLNFLHSLTSATWQSRTNNRRTGNGSQVEKKNNTSLFHIDTSTASSLLIGHVINVAHCRWVTMTYSIQAELQTTDSVSVATECNGSGFGTDSGFPPSLHAGKPGKPAPILPNTEWRQTQCRGYFFPKVCVVLKTTTPQSSKMQYVSIGRKKKEDWI